ncbi:DNA-binding response regulator [Sphaerisporangium album]|uniref:DNA-binding response regulator n=1 Tax=Sphaerisporangium album TaxID=509200 RepID=A0A367FII9_9ACTN|nr:response regulator transcription factor [Sphaerisporangium album]RCG29709.1 DNA-binding response regulator [Sphaerisporangium album]
MHVLLVEDDEPLAEALRDGLGRFGYRVDWVGTGRAALAAAPAEMVLLDLGLPDGDGLDVCRTLRGRGDVPIIVISGRTDETERIVGLEMGADDYVTKPFGLREVVARMRAVARRARPGDGWPGAPESGQDGNGAGRPAVPGLDRHGRLGIDRRARRVYADDREVTVTPKEYDLLAYLAEDDGALLTRESIMRAVWDANWFGPTKTLDAHVGALRRKLGEVARIETVRGVGFRLVVTP